MAEWKSKPQGPSLYQTKDIGYAVINVVSVTSLSVAPYLSSHIYRKCPMRSIIGFSLYHLNTKNQKTMHSVKLSYFLDKYFFSLGIEPWTFIFLINGEMVFKNPPPVQKSMNCDMNQIRRKKCQIAPRNLPMATKRMLGRPTCRLIYMKTYEVTLDLAGRYYYILCYLCCRLGQLQLNIKITFRWN